MLLVIISSAAVHKSYPRISRKICSFGLFPGRSSINLGLSRERLFYSAYAGRLDGP